MIRINENVDFCQFSLICCHFFRFFENFVFQIFGIMFPAHEFFINGKRYYFIQRSLNLCFRSMLKFSKKNSIFVIYHHFWRSRPVLVLFFVPSRALLVQSASLLTHLYLGKNYAYRKGIVKHISKLHFSTEKI